MNIDISPELEKDFKRFVLEKHGKLRGKLSEEMEKAISSYLAQESISILGKTLRTLQATKLRAPHINE